MTRLAMVLMYSIGCEEQDVSEASQPEDTGLTAIASTDVEAVGQIEVTGDSMWTGTLWGSCEWFGDDPLLVSPVAIDLVDPDDDAFDFFNFNPVMSSGIYVSLGEVDSGSEFVVYQSTTETTTIERLPNGDVAVTATGTRLGLESSTASFAATIAGCVDQ